MDPKAFLRTALKYAKDNNIEFNGYSTQYEHLRNGVLPLFRDCSPVGMIKADPEGHFQYERLWRKPPRIDSLRYFS